MLKSNKVFSRHMTGRRDKNIVMMDLPDEEQSVDGATLDADKTGKVRSTTRVREETVFHPRLGHSATPNSKLPVLVSMVTRDAKEQILTKVNILKMAGDIYNEIYIKSPAECPHVMEASTKC